MTTFGMKSEKPKRPIFRHFGADKVEYRNGKLRRLVFKPNRITGRRLSLMQYYEYISGQDFEIIEYMKKGIIYYS